MCGAPDVSLAALQRGMLARILGTSTSVGLPTIAAGAAPPTPDERLSVYVRGYVGRLCECLAADFPALRGLVGEQVFDLFARGYLCENPSRSRSLYDLGAGFAVYLAKSRPANSSDPLDTLPADLARLERARTEAHRARGLERAGHADVSALIVMMPHVRLKTPETLRLVSSDFALKTVLDEIERGERPTVPASRSSFYAVARIDYRVAVHELSAAQFAFVEACAGGGDLASSLAAADPHRTSVPDLLAWVPRAIALGLLTTGV